MATVIRAKISEKNKKSPQRSNTPISGIWIAGGLSCNVWMNLPVISKYVTWTWSYAACFISACPSAYRIYLL